MTGIERLRGFARRMDELSVWPGGAKLLSIADQIERELDEETGREYEARQAWQKRCVLMEASVGMVLRDMERHVSGVEGMEDSPVARWARELREALGATMSRHESDAVAGSPCDGLSEEDREALEWVREHGGPDAMVELSSRLMTVDALRAAIEETCTRIGVERTGDLTQDAQAIWREIGALRSRLKESVPRAAYERHLARRQRQIDESHAALRRRNARIGFLVSELNRAKHENHEEFMRRAGDYTAFTDEVCKLLASELRYVEGCSKDVMDAALDALARRLMPAGYEWPRYEDGEPVIVGEYGVTQVDFYFDGLRTVWGNAVKHENLLRGEHVRRPAVLAADGEPLEVGQTVWHEDGTELRVAGFKHWEDDEAIVRVEYVSGPTRWGEVRSLSLTHTKSEPRDSWERLEEDAEGIRRDIAMHLGDYSQSDFEEPGDSVQSRVVDLVRRCRALSERERGE